MRIEIKTPNIIDDKRLGPIWGCEIGTFTLEATTCKVCKEPFEARGHYDRERLLSVGICDTCDFWVEKWQLRDDPKTVRINGQHYIIGAQLDDYELDPTDTLEDIAKRYSSNRNVKGMSGVKYIIRFDDGRLAITDDLWHQGEIPAHWRNALPDNATLEVV